MVVVLAASIALHEVGHLVPAKRFGVKVTQYMIGFGPTLWSRTKGETEYGVKWIPAGGYIRMIGMFPPRAGEDEHHLRASSTGAFQTLAEDARHASAQEVQAGRRGPRLLQAVGAEEGRRHARRPDDEPAHRRRAVHDPAGRLRRPARAARPPRRPRGPDLHGPGRRLRRAVRAGLRRGPAEDPGVRRRRASRRRGGVVRRHRDHRLGADARAHPRQHRPHRAAGGRARRASRSSSRSPRRRTRSPGSSTARSSSTRTASPRPCGPASSASRRSRSWCRSR